MSETVLLTGATGFLGMELLARLIEQSDSEILALVRAKDQSHADQRLATVLEQLYGEKTSHIDGRVRAVPGEVSEPHLGLAEHAKSLVDTANSIIHCAARVSFDTSASEALKNNTLGAAHILALAERLHASGRLRQLVHVSTAYVCGDHAGQFTELDLDLNVEFRNHYERSKAYAEHLLRSSVPDLPLLIARPSIIVGDSRSGWTSSFNVIYWPLRAFEAGLLREIPGQPGGILDIVPVDYVADALIALHGHSSRRGTVHLVTGPDAITNEHLAGLASHAMGSKPATFTAGGAPQLEQMALFGPYFNIQARFTRTSTDRALSPERIVPPAFPTYFPILLDYARRSRWGKRPLTRAEALTPRRADPAVGLAADSGVITRA